MATMYLDYAAGTPILQEVLECYPDFLYESFANPSSAHGAGRAAAAALVEATDKLCDLFGAKDTTMILTSGGTESINLALKGHMTPRRFSPHLLISAGEHAAVRAVSSQLERSGVKVTIAPLNRDGVIDLDSLQFEDDDLPTLVSVVLVSNETGALLDTEKLVDWQKRICPEAAIHLDAIQAAGKIDLNFSALGVDYMSLSGHKWGAPKSTGLLIVKKGRALSPLIAGGGQQGGLRGGTIDVPIWRAATLAAGISVGRIDAFAEKAKQLKYRLLEKLLETGLTFDCLSPESALPHILSLSFPNLYGETLVRVLSDAGIFISQGAACSGSKRGENQVLSAIGCDKRQIEGAVRISFGFETTPDDIDRAAEEICQAVLRFGRPWHSTGRR